MLKRLTWRKKARWWVEPVKAMIHFQSTCKRSENTKNILEFW